MKKIAFVVVFIAAAAVFAVTASAKQYFFDDIDCASEETAEQLNSELKELSDECGFSVGILITDNIGKDKSDDGAMDYADVYQEKKFGMNADAIMLMISLDPKNNVYWITTSGSCIRRFPSGDIDKIFDNIESVQGGKLKYEIEELGKAVRAFMDSVPAYAGYNSGSSGSVGLNGSPVFNLNFIIVILVVNVIIIAGFVGGVKNSYKISRAKGAGNYLNRSSVHYYQQSDTFIRTYVTKTRIQSSSRHGGGGGSHRSSGGGSHGGGGRH